MHNFKSTQFLGVTQDVSAASRTHILKSLSREFLCDDNKSKDRELKKNKNSSKATLTKFNMVCFI